MSGPQDNQEFTILPPGSPGAMGWAGKEALLPDTGLGTRCVHGGAAPDPAYGSVAPPVYETSTFAMLDVRTSAGFEYSRAGNPDPVPAGGGHRPAGGRLRRHRHQFRA